MEPNLQATRRWRQAKDKGLGALTTLILYATFALRLSSLLSPAPPPALFASLVSYCTLCLAMVAWRQSGWRFDAYARHRESMAVLLRLCSTGLGAWAALTGQMLQALPAAAASSAAGHLALLVFASGGPSLVHHALAFRTRFWLSALVQAFLVWTIARQHPAYCAAPALTSPTARRYTARLYALLALQAYTLPLPLSALVVPDVDAQCATLLTWLLVAIGLVAPLLWEAVGEARSLVQVQRRRSAAGLLPDRGLDPWLLSCADVLAEEGSGLAQVASAWVLAALCWDLAALVCVPQGQRAPWLHPATS